MKVVHLTPTPMAQVPYRYCQLINKYTEHTAVYLQGQAFYLGTKSDILSQEKDRVLQEIWSADVLHIHGHKTFDTKIWCGIHYRINPNTEVFLEYHGLPERGRIGFKRPVKTIVSTPEMLQTFREAIYFPVLVDEGIIKRKKILPSFPPLKICQGWSFHTKVKDTAYFDCLVNLKSPYFQAEKLEQMTGDQFVESLQNYHAIFDHLQGYYGVVSLEGLALGMLVFNGATGHTVQQIKYILGTGFPPPFNIVDKETFKGRLEMLATSKNTPGLFDKGREYVEKYWSGRKLINLLIDIYNSDALFSQTNKVQRDICNKTFTISKLPKVLF